MRLRTLLACLVVAATLTSVYHGYARPRAVSGGVALPRECATAHVSLTGGGRVGWRMNDHVEFVGSASAVVCESDAGIVAASSKALLAALGGVVVDWHYGMILVCKPEAEFAGAAPLSPDLLAKRRAEFQKAHQEMVARLNGVLPRPVIRDVQCRFGWVSYWPDGGTSGVS